MPAYPHARKLNAPLGLLAGLIAGLLGPVVQITSLVGNVGTFGIVSQALSGALTIDLSPSTAPNVQPTSATPLTGPFLYVWNAYGNSYTDPLISLANKDFLATIDLNPASPTYKQLIAYEKLPVIGTEPHHISISSDRTRLIGSGLLAFLQGLVRGGERARACVYAKACVCVVLARPQSAACFPPRALRAARSYVSRPPCRRSTARRDSRVARTLCRLAPRRGPPGLRARPGARRLPQPKCTWRAERLVDYCGPLARVCARACMCGAGRPVRL